ncbi:MAG TPA: hypothetical protein VN920_09240 [Pyrinomonadaceae bacterium]|nr:hypothetical protein [Pyrinomonadaceae bacterium]
MKNEKLIFDSFLKACPDFANEPIEDWDVVEDWYVRRWLEPPPHPFDKRPDIIARTASGKRIGVELKSWVNREQITEARKQERTQQNILKAIGEQPPNATQHIGYIWLSARQVRFDQRDAANFHQQMFGLIEQVDNTWSQKPDWDQELFDNVHDFAGFPILEKYLRSVEFHPCPRFDMDWIQFPTAGGFYSPNQMLGTLSTALLAHRSDVGYKDLRTQAWLNEVYLLVHYDFKAFAYNTPFDAPNFGFEQAAKFAADVLAGDGGYFGRIFLFHFLWGKEEAYRIFPSFSSSCP